MDVVHVNVPLRTGKKMKKRKELDALVANSLAKRSCGGGAASNKRCTAGNGISSQDQLLSESTDEQEAYWNNGTEAVGKRPRGARISRRRTLLSAVRACTALLVLTCVVATITVMWLLIDVREQITSLRSELDQVVASNQGVPDALQKCHSVSRGLQQNQTHLSAQLETLRKQLENFTQQVTDVKNGLNQVQERLKENPELVNLPRDVQQLLSSVAQFGSQIKDLSTTVLSLKEQNIQHSTTESNILQNITALQTALSNIQNNSSPAIQSPLESLAMKDAIAKAIAQVSFNLTRINDTLSSRLQWIVDDENKDHKLLIGLQEMNQSVIVRVTRLEDTYQKMLADQLNMSSVLYNLTGQLKATFEDVAKLDLSLAQLRTQYLQLNLSDSQQQIAINDLHQSLQHPPEDIPQRADEVHANEQVIKVPSTVAAAATLYPFSVTQRSTTAFPQPPVGKPKTSTGT